MCLHGSCGLTSPGQTHLSLPTFLEPHNLPLLALKGPWILAGGETTGSTRLTLGALARAPDVVGACGIISDQAPVRRPCWGAKAIMAGFPVVSPPANLRCASGARRKNVGKDKTLCPQSRLWSPFLPRIAASSRMSRN